MPSKLKAGSVVAIAAIGLSIPVLAFGGTGLTAQMDGKQVVNPAGGDPDGSATLTMKVNRVKKRVCFQLSTRKLDKVTGAFVHKGGAGAIARPVITLFEGSERASGCVHGLRGRIVKRLKRKPDAHYADLTTKAYPKGAVRGQIER